MSRCTLVGGCALALLGCGGSTPLGGPPVAALRAPPTCDLGGVVLLDASASSDPDGDIVRYRFIVADGSPMQDLTESTARHVCRTAGLIEATVEVVDVHGGVDRATAWIAVRRP